MAATQTPFGTLRLSVEGAQAGRWEEVDLPTARGCIAYANIDLAEGREAAMTLELSTASDCTTTPAFADGMEAHHVRSPRHRGVFAMPDGVWIDGQPGIRLMDFAADATSISYALSATDSTTLMIPAAIAWMTPSDTDTQAVLAAVADILSLQGIPTCPKS
ncbi:MAG: hypothetical protein AAF367_06895 [Pseudomonadota bacterium]